MRKEAPCASSARASLRSDEKAPTVFPTTGAFFSLYAFKRRNTPAAGLPAKPAADDGTCDRGGKTPARPAA